MSYKPFVAIALGLAALTVTAVHAQSPSEYAEQGQLIRSSRNITGLGVGLFGDRVNIYTGALEFVQTDISLPGNNALPVQISRRLKTGQTRYAGGLFADWELDIPHLKGVVSRDDGWSVDQLGAGRFRRCTFFGEPAVANSVTSEAQFIPQNFWFGYLMNVPGAGEQEMLQRTSANSQQPTDGGAYPALTAAGWNFRCLPALASGQPGEGFLAIAPDGTQYRFDWMVSRKYASYQSFRPSSGASKATMTAGSPEPAPQAPNGDLLARAEIFIYPTQVKDRFGNLVNYNYSSAYPERLTSISSSDNRTITLSYLGTSNLVSSVSDGTRTWRYSYGAGLTSVTLPDQSAWAFSGDALTLSPIFQSPPFNCTANGIFNPEDMTKTMVHPSGATGAFKLRQTLHGRSYMQANCPNSSGSYASWFPVNYLVRSLVNKTITGPGLPTLAWSFNYGSANGGVLPCTGCVGTKTVLVTDPRNVVTRHTFGNRWRDTEGLLLRLDEGWNASTGTALRSTVNTYRSPAAGPYPAVLGFTMQPRGDGFHSAQHHPVEQRVITQQGATFTRQVTSFDLRARPLATTKSSSLGPTRTDTTAYHDNTNKWVLGQIASITEASTGLVAEHHTYDLATANRLTSHSFGRLTDTYTYNPEGTPVAGTLAVRRDAVNRATVYSNYKRGLAQNISYPDGTTESAAVNDLGFITSVTNAAGTTTEYRYDDPMGRLSRITPPGGDPVAYNATVLAFERRTIDEFGLPPGHWRQTVTTGAARTERYFDALWRPLLTLTWDTNNPGATSRVVQTRFDADGRKTFDSYAQRSIASITTPVTGTTTTYDPLGRITQQTQDSELGPLTTTTAYLSGFLRQTTDPRLNTTTTAFQAFDTPSEEAITSITAPVGVLVSIQRDVFGKPKAITRSGAGLSATRAYAYDLHQRLCKTIEPETAATVQAYDPAGNIAWRASGLSLPNANACDDTSVPANRKISHTYDARDRLQTSTYGDNSPGTTRSYTADGLPSQIWSSGTTWTYTYNQRRLLTTETLAYGSGTYQTTWTPDPNGHTSTLSYPGGPTVAYAPNALGEPTQAGAYASSITHHPNGAVAGYTLGNGISHSLTQNTRGLPLQNRDAGVMQDLYAYDPNANVTGITDQQEGISTRTLAYDALDRLTQANSPTWGTALYTYDTLDNIRTSSVGSRALNHNIDPTTNRLLSLSGSQNIGFSYDLNGNVTNRAGQPYLFDIGNRLRVATGKASYAYDGHGRRTWVAYADASYRLQVYSQSGKLLYGAHSAQGNTRYIYLGDKLIAETNNQTGVTYTHTDALGSPVARTNAAGLILSRTRYEPYGATAAGTNPTGIGFTGHVNDIDTGLVYMQQRYYEPLAGRFLSVDPVVTDANSGGSFNRYKYANNNPLRFIDPDGRNEAEARARERCISGPYDCRIVTYEPSNSASSSSTASAGAVTTTPGATYLGAGSAGGNGLQGVGVAGWLSRLLGAFGLAAIPSNLADGTRTGHILQVNNDRRSALNAAGVDKLNAEGLDVHHIVQRGHLGSAVAVANLTAVGMTVHDLANLVILSRADHQSGFIHTPEYRAAVNAATTRAVPGGRSEMTRELDLIRSALIIKGTYP